MNLATAEFKINGQKWKLWKKGDDKRVTHKYSIWFKRRTDKYSKLYGLDCNKTLKENESVKSLHHFYW